MPQWYRVDTSKLSWAEARRQAPSPVTYAVLAGMKLIGKSLPVPGAVPRLDDPAIVPGEALPGAVAREFAHRAAALQRLPESFRPIFYQSPPRIGSNVTYTCVLLSEDGRTVARLTHATSGTTKKLVTALHSWRPDGTCLATGDKAQEFDPAPKTSNRFAPGAEVPTLAETHRQHVKEAGGRQGVRVIEESEVAAALLAYDQAGVDHLARRGILVKLSPQEVASIR